MILYRQHAQRGQLVSAVSTAARRCGVRSGMPLSEATSLVKHRTGDGQCAAGGAHRAGRELPSHFIVEHDQRVDRQVLGQLALACHQFSPTVGLEQTDQPACILLEVAGTAHLFGGANSLATRVREHFQQRGYWVHTAIAPTLGMAWGLARYGAMPAPADPAPRASAASRSRPEPARPTDVSDFALALSAFRSLPLEALRLQANTIEVLHELGITHIHQLQQLPRAGLHSRFGDEITQRLDQAQGVLEEVIVSLHPAADFSAEQFLDYPIRDQQTIQVIISRLADQLCGQLRAEQRGGLVWHCDLRGPSTEPLQLEIKLFQPIARPEHLMPLVQMQLENLFSGGFPPDRSIRRGKRRATQAAGTPWQIQEIALSVRNCVLLAERQRHLFDEHPRLDRQSLSQLINRLSSRLGAENVVAPRLQSGAKVEQACLFEPLVGAPAPPPRRRQPTKQSISPLERPLTLHAQPLELSAVSVGGQQPRSTNAPALFVSCHERLHVVRRWGPERIETAWWHGPTLRRDYWRVETHDGRWLWIFHNLSSRRWFLQGEF